MLRTLYILFFFILISCSSIQKEPIVDYYPAPQIPSINYLSSKRVVFLYKNKEISKKDFDTLMRKRKKMPIQVIKDSLQIVKMGYNPQDIRGIVSVEKKK